MNQRTCKHCSKTLLSEEPCNIEACKNFQKLNEDSQDVVLESEIGIEQLIFKIDQEKSYLME